MTKLQYLRWKFFALGMAKHGFPNATEARRRKLLDDLEGYLNWIGEDGWDEPPVYTKYEDWDGMRTGAYLCTDVDDYFSEYYHESFKGRERGNKYLNQLTCCLRAGFDVAVYPSAGVMGFTLGCVRRIFNGSLPAWVRDFFGNHQEIDTAPDDASVWL